MIKPLSKSLENPLSVREKTYSLLKKQLLTGQLRPNKRLTEESLAKKFGVSRTPVRDALHKLELEGLVKVAGARGFCVPEDSVEDMSELFEIRAVLEGHALACICKIITQENIQSLKKLVQSAEQAFLTGKLDLIFDYNTQFSIIEDMREYVLRYRKNTLAHHDGVRRSISGHKKILMALDLREPQLCERIMRKHIYEAKEDTIVYGD
jgi:DNA-binding GntR family transcriptional regulator